MAKKSAIYKEYIIEVKDDGGIEVYRIFDNVKASLREASEIVGFEVNPTWGTRQLGHKLIQTYGENKQANIGNYFLAERENGAIEVYRTYANTKEALREIAGQCGMEIEAAWTTRQIGSKLIDFILQNK